MELKSLIETRNTLIASAGAIAQDKNTTPEKREQVKKMFVDIDALQEQIDIAKSISGFAEENRAAGIPPRAQVGEHIDVTPERTELEKRAFTNFITGRMKPEDHQYLKTETRDLTVGAPGAVTGGGVLVPIGYDPTLHVALKSYGEILGAVRTWNSETGEGVRVSLANDTTNAFTVIGENTAVTESDPSLSGFTSYTDTLTSGLIRVSNQLIQDSAFSIESFLTDQIGQRYYRGAAQMVTTGNASNITGIVAGATVGETLPTGNTTVLTYPELVSIYSALDPAYIQNSSFAVNSTTWASMLNITDTLDRPLLQQDVNGTPFRSLFGRPIIIAQALDNLGARRRCCSVTSHLVTPSVRVVRW
jgi:HK97 family phage major capsid protein